MKKLLVSILLFGLCLLTTSAQKLTTGIVSGSNFSTIRGDNQSGEWKSKTGSVTGIWFNYAFNPVLSIGTELNYISLYYQHMDYQPSYIGVFNDMIIAPFQYNSKYWNFNFYRIPLYLKLSTPTKLRFELTGGMYYSLLQQPSVDNYTGNTYPKSDIGTIFSAGFAYPITNNVEAFIRGRYSSGSKEYIPDNKGKNGASELVFGIGYSGIFHKMKGFSTRSQFKDSADCKISIKYRSGMNVSWITADKNQNSYSGKAGFTSGVSINYSLGENCGIQTELLFENKGYQLKDSTASHFRFVPNPDKYTNSYSTRTTVENTYFTIPLLFELKSAQPFTVYFNTGPYLSSLINAKTSGTQTAEYRSNGSYYSKSKTVINDNIEGSVSHVDWGWIVGGGVQIPVIYNWKLDIEGRYQAGWSNRLHIPASPSSNPETGSTRSMQNRSFTLLVGLQVPIY